MTETNQNFIEPRRRLGRASGFIQPAPRNFPVGNPAVHTARRWSLDRCRCRAALKSWTVDRDRIIPPPKFVPLVVGPHIIETRPVTSGCPRRRGTPEDGVFLAAIATPRHAVDALKSWQEKSSYWSPGDWVFASDVFVGKQPLWLGTLCLDFGGMHFAAPALPCSYRPP